MTFGIIEFWKYSDLQDTILNELTCRRKLPLMVVDHKYWMDDQFKKLYRVSTIFPPIFFDKDIPVLISDVIFHERSL